MAYSDNFAAAKELSLKLLDQYSPKSEFLILLLCNTGNDTSLFWQTKSRAKEFINNATISCQKGDLQKTIGTANIPDPRYNLEYVYFGDCQENNFIGFDKISLTQDTFFAIKTIAGSNVAITSADLADPVSVPDNYYQLNVSVWNYGHERWNGVINVKTPAYQTEHEIEIAAHSEQLMKFSIPVQSHYGVISIYDDSLTTDNIRYFSKIISGQLKILAINSNPYIRAGLLTRDIKKSPFDTDFLPVLGGHDLRKYDVLILNGISEINNGEKLRLKNFLADSTKGLLCFLDNECGDNLNELIAPCSAEAFIEPQGYVTLDWIDLHNRVFDVFHTANALRNIKFYRFQKINNKGRVIARLSNNYPLITRLKNMFVIAAEFVPTNTDIVYKTTYIPILYRLIVSAGLQDRDREFVVGDKASTQLTTPSDLTLVKGNIFLIPGFYLDQGDSVAVNVDPAESDLKPLGKEQAKALNITMIDQREFFGGTELSSFFLILALIAILLEVGLLLIK